MSLSSSASYHLAVLCLQFEQQYVGNSDRGLSWSVYLYTPAVLGEHLEADSRPKDCKDQHEDDVHGHLPSVCHQVKHPAITLLLSMFRMNQAEAHAKQLNVVHCVGTRTVWLLPMHETEPSLGVQVLSSFLCDV